MVVVRWLEVSDKGISFPRFDRHNGESAKKRALTARRQSDFRKRKSNAGVTQSTLPREEKRRDITPIPPDEGYSPAFQRFWDQWPASKRKQAKFKCGGIWRTKKLDALADQILAHLEAAKCSDQWRSGYDPAPLTYLNQQRWEDGTPHATERGLVI
jgi:hypothetical protein